MRKAKTCCLFLLETRALSCLSCSFYGLQSLMFSFFADDYVIILWFYHLTALSLCVYHVCKANNCRNFCLITQHAFGLTESVFTRSPFLARQKNLSHTIELCYWAKNAKLKERPVYLFLLTRLPPALPPTSCLHLFPRHFCLSSFTSHHSSLLCRACN